MTGYEKKLNEFAEGKQFIRLSRPVRDRADATCDVCGSTRPRMLYGLKCEDTDGQHERFFFVGDNCLKELVKRGAVLKRFGRQSARTAFDQEMQRRAEGSNGTVNKIVAENNQRTSSRESADGGSSNRPTAKFEGLPVLVIVVAQDGDEIRTFACFPRSNASNQSWLRRREPIHRKMEASRQRSGRSGKS